MAFAPKCGRRAFVDSGNYRVETAQAAKACRERNLGQGQVGIVDQALGALTPCRLGDLGGRGADMLLEQAQQVSRANAEPLGKRFDARLVERTFVDETHRPLNGGALDEAGVEALAERLRSEEDTAELPTLTHTQCPLLLEKKKTADNPD